MYVPDAWSLEKLSVHRFAHRSSVSRKTKRSWISASFLFTAEQLIADQKQSGDDDNQNNGAFNKYRNQHPKRHTYKRIPDQSAHVYLRIQHKKAYTILIIYALLPMIETIIYTLCACHAGGTKIGSVFSYAIMIPYSQRHPASRPAPVRPPPWPPCAPLRYPFL